MTQPFQVCLNLSHIRDFLPSLCLPASDPKLRGEERTELVQCHYGPTWMGTTSSPPWSSSILSFYGGGPWVVCLSSQAPAVPLCLPHLLASQLLAHHENLEIALAFYRLHTPHPPSVLLHCCPSMTVSRTWLWVLISPWALSWKQVTQALSTFRFPNLKGDSKKEGLFPSPDPDTLSSFLLISSSLQPRSFHLLCLSEDGEDTWSISKCLSLNLRENGAGGWVRNK